jgi:integrase
MAHQRLSKYARWPADGDPALRWKGSASSETTMTAEGPIASRQRDPWNKGRMTGQKRRLKPKDVWTIRVRLQLEGRKRDLAMFNLAIDSKLRGCDVVQLRVDDLRVGGRIRDRATVIQKKTGRPVQFEATEQARSAIAEWLAAFDTARGRYLFPSRFRQQPHLSTRQYACIVRRWVERAGLDSSAYGTHSLRRTKAAQIYRKTGNLRVAHCCLATRSWRAPFAI